jgi:predicted transposase/invertase (TIGR01784 family)
LQEILINPNEDLLDVKLDPIFKAVFTSETKESRGALKSFISAYTGHEIADISILANEPPVEQQNEKQIRFDFSCRFNNGKRATVEMALKHRPDELVRSEYYTARLLVAQANKGDEDYSELGEVYQITLLSEGELIKDKELIHEFEYYDKIRNKSLNGKTRILTFEMSKLQKINKQISDMDSKELWGTYLKWVNDKSRISQVNEIIKLEGGTGMATQALRSISTDEKMQMMAINAQ